MKKLWLGLGLLAALLALGLGVLGMLGERSRRAGAALERAAGAAEAGDMALALDRAGEALRYWQAVTPSPSSWPWRRTVSGRTSWPCAPACGS